jgi:hypothetical protein
VLGLLLAAGASVVAPAAAAPGPDWGPEQDVPPTDRVHELPRSAVFPDGTLVTVWEEDDTGSQDDLTRIFRSTRPPGGAWSEPLALPVADVWNLQAIAPRPDGSLMIAYGWEPRFPEILHRVRVWHADGTVGPVGLHNTSDDWTLSGDAEGDVVAERLGSYDEEHGFDHLLRYHDGTRWVRMPKVGADPRDTFVAGPGESVWMAGYDQARTVLRVRRWRPGAREWRVEWSRDYPSGHARKPLVEGLDLATGAAGRVTLAFLERAVGRRGDTLRSVTRRDRRGWTDPVALERVAPGERRIITAPVVAATGGRAEVAWTVSSPLLAGRRDVRLAGLARGETDVLTVAAARSFSGFRDLSLDVDVRTGGDVLVTYLDRVDDERVLTAWLGPHGALQGEQLIGDAGVMLGDAAFLVPGLAAVVSSAAGDRLLSVSED